MDSRQIVLMTMWGLKFGRMVPGLPHVPLSWKQTGDTEICWEYLEPYWEVWHGQRKLSLPLLTVFPFELICWSIIGSERHGSRPNALGSLLTPHGRDSTSLLEHRVLPWHSFDTSSLVGESRLERVGVRMLGDLLWPSLWHLWDLRSSCSENWHYSIRTEIMSEQTYLEESYRKENRPWEIYGHNFLI